MYVYWVLLAVVKESTQLLLKKSGSLNASRNRAPRRGGYGFGHTHRRLPGATAHAAPAAEASAVISLVDVASVASSLEEAANKVKQLTEFTGAHKLKVSVKELTEEVQTLLT